MLFFFGLAEPETQALARNQLQFAASYFYPFA